jgi:hypothetical protein
MNKLQPNRLNDGKTKLQNTDDKMILLNLITQEYNKYIHYKIEKDKFKSVLKDLLKNPQEINESSESQELHKPQEIYESSSNFEIKNEMEQIENHLEFDIIYEKNEPDEIIYYDNQPKLKTVAKIMYSKHNLDQLIKKKKW